jgi:hypothetical protein
VPTITALITEHRPLVLHTVPAGQGRIPSSSGEVRLLRVYLYFPLFAKCTSVPVLLYGPLVTSRASGCIACSVQVVVPPGRALKMRHCLYILCSNKLIIGILGRDYGGLTITAGRIRSRNRTLTKHLGHPLLDHYP